MTYNPSKPIEDDVLVLRGFKGSLNTFFLHILFLILSAETLLSVSEFKFFKKNLLKYTPSKPAVM